MKTENTKFKLIQNNSKYYIVYKYKIKLKDAKKKKKKKNAMPSP